ncbi:urea ABC transporter permease [Pseudoalteromonas distincta]|uniref:Urea ABC transporter permease subunit UrtB n=1 Tax=Pseudoalteromonas distincta TaxID=77608 RepID=A0ABT9GH94_9GAMM|nr:MULTISPECIES: urea ABC transporter permease subunit UrtB [Pseudoalteromonas distincta group]KHM50572.1 urea ABC transporter permease [Pseudoalteromonas elyakovii]KID33525.1 urea ABC transporter permease [Pseudoalteromonas distincta]MDP4485270.1 urea ABC transporter permease subunit UrtB [Pseudoalteromonas elyakovii]
MNFNILRIVILICFTWSSLVSAKSDAQFDKLVAKLPTSNFKSLAPLLDKIALSDDPRSSELLGRLSQGDVYFVPSSKQVLYMAKDAQGTRTYTDVITTQAIDTPQGRLKKVRVNNYIRTLIQQLQAQQNLNNPDKVIRLSAAKEILRDVDSIYTETLNKRLAKEDDEEIIDILDVIVALKQLKSGDENQLDDSLTVLKGSLEPDVRATLMNELNAIDKHSASSIKDIQRVLDTIDRKRKWYGYVENIFFGLSLGSVLLLAAIGLAITFGVMGVINMAHGEMIMLGAYTTYVVQQLFPDLLTYSLFIAVPAAFLVSGLVGIIIERCVIQFLKGRPLETLLATFGVSLILQQLVRTVFSPLNRQVASPEWMSGSWQINPALSVTFNRLYIILFSLSVFFALLVFLKKSSLGLHVRAVAQNREMAKALSIKSNWVDAATFGLGSGIAGIAGVVLSQLTNVGPNLGQAYIIDSFLVVVFGGVGNLWGALVSAMSLGILNKFLEPLTGPVMASILVLVGLVFFIQKRPQGLFPKKGRAE